MRALMYARMHVPINLFKRMFLFQLIYASVCGDRIARRKIEPRYSK